MWVERREMFWVIYLKLKICVLSRVGVNNIKNEQTKKPQKLKKGVVLWCNKMSKLWGNNFFIKKSKMNTDLKAQSQLKIMPQFECLLSYY